MPLQVLNCTTLSHSSSTIWGVVTTENPIQRIMSRWKDDRKPLDLDYNLLVLHADKVFIEAIQGSSESSHSEK
jgi:hypothetical protein